VKRRKLRIVWSVAWGIVAVLLVALWVRSYWAWDFYYGWFHPPGFLQVESDFGRLELIAVDDLLSLDSRWQLESTDAVGGSGQWLISLQKSPRWKLQIIIPDWFAILITTSAAALPWTSWWKHFSLRAFLVATTLVAIGLALAVWADK
jgi:hypothetical protein